MTTEPLSVFEELDAMLVFGTETPLTSVGQVEDHLRQARHSLMISRINGNMGQLAGETLLEDLTKAFGQTSAQVVALKGMMQHMDEMLSIEIMTTERDIVVMESFLRFMGSAEGDVK